MASIRKFRKIYSKWHAQYERRAMKLIMPVFKQWSKNIRFDDMTESNYKTIIKEAINDIDLSDPYLAIYNQVGAANGRRMGVIINDESKAFQFSLFITQFESLINVFFGKYGVNRITSIAETFFEDIVSLLETRTQRELTMRQAAKEVQKLVNKRNFYRWQAMRIARTESTAAANYGGLIAGQVSGFVMEKIWIAGLDERTRTSHANADGQRVLIHEDFILEMPTLDGTTEPLMYAGDPSASAGNVINCRCSTPVTPKRDANGSLVRTDEIIPLTFRPARTTRTPQIEPIIPAIIPEINQSMADFEDLIRNQDFESAGVYDEDGNVIFTKDGESRSVGFTYEEMNKIYDATNGTLTHNHPSGRSFSDADIRLLIQNRITEMRAVGEYGAFRMTKNQAYIPHDQQKRFKRAYGFARKKATKATDKWLADSTPINESYSDLNIKRANHKIVDLTWIYFAETKFGKEFFKYIKPDGYFPEYLF